MQPLFLEVQTTAIGFRLLISITFAHETQCIRLELGC